MEISIELAGPRIRFYIRLGRRIALEFWVRPLNSEFRMASEQAAPVNVSRDTNARQIPVTWPRPRRRS